MHFPRHALSVVLLLALASSLKAAPTDWSFTKIATVGMDGFTSLTDGRVGNGGAIVVSGVRSGQTGLFLVAAGTTTVVVTQGTVLPDNLGTVSLLGSDFEVDPFGRVVFTARVTGGSLPSSTAFRAFRSAAGVITRMLPGDGFTHTPRAMASDGRWIAEQITGTFPNQTHVVHLTDGVTSTQVFTFARSSVNCRGENNLNLTPNAAGNILFHHSVQQSQFTPGQFGGSCGVNEAFTRTWDYSIAGPGATTITTGLRTVSFGSPGVDTGTESFVAFGLLNDAGSVTWSREIYSGPPLFFGDGNPPAKRQLVLKDASGERVLVETSITDATQINGPFGLDPVGRVAFTTSNQTTQEFALFSGPDLTKDRVLGSGDSLFGSAQRGGFNPLAVSAPPGTFGDKRVFLFTYTLDDAPRTTGIASASKQVTRWTSSTGGAWSTALNWSPAVVPAAGIETVFDLEASYDVNVGTVTSGRSNVQNGSVGFRSANLTLIGPLTIGDDAILTQPEGKITANELTIGFLPPVNPLLPPTARFNLSNKNTEFVTTGTTLIGNAGIGELFISDALMTSGEVRIGAGSKGTASIGIANALWKTGALAVGFSHEGTLNIERSAHIDSTSAVIGLGSELKNDLATVNVDNANGAAPTPGTGNWFVTGTLTIGDKLPGRLNISQGGVIGVGDRVKTALAKHSGVLDATIEIDGTGSTTAKRSSAFFLTDLEVASGPNSFADVTVLAGGFLHTGASLIIGEAPGSTGEIFVSGVNANDLRSELEQGTTSNADLKVGHRGEGFLIISDGAIVNCRQILIGGLAGGRGEVHIAGRQRNRDATLTATDFVVVGGNTVFGTVEGSPGILTLQNGGRIDVGSLIVSRNGRVRGNGTIVSGATLNMDGVIEPGVGFEAPIEPLVPSGGRNTSGGGGAALRDRQTILAATAPVLPGTLTIQGNLVLGATGVIQLDVNGSTASGASDKLVVNGALTLGGTVVLNFTNGYAPRAGDTLDFVSATSVSGSFATTTITGLAPGFQFSVAPNGSGGVRLTALNNAVAATAIGSRLSNLSVRTPLASGQNLIVGFVVQGGAKSMLVRAAGPGLAQFLAGTHPDPRITLFNSASVIVDSNDNWPGALTPTMQALSAFPFASGSNDAALQRSVEAAHTAHVNGPGAGIVLVELYDAAAGVSPRLVNVSARNQVGTGDGVLIAGFIIEGTSPKTVLVRGIGPTLTVFGVGGVLVDPQLALFDSTSTQLAQNDNWSDALATTFAAVQAFPLTSGTKDAAFVVTLAPGAYTAQVSGVGGTTGEALVEIYEVP